MSGLKTSDVLHVAQLANLKLSKSEVEKFRKQLSQVVDYFRQLNEVDTSEIEPTSQTTGLIDVLRDDEVDSLNALTDKEALSGTEKIHNNYFVVPQVIQKE